MTNTLTFAIAGAAGRMGRQLIASALSRGHAVIGGTERSGSPALSTDLGLLAGSGPIGRRPTPHVAEAARGADAWLDFTTPSATLEALDALAGSSVRTAIIGTTGFSGDEARRIDAHSGRFAIVRSGNFSLGIALLAALARTAAGRLGPDWDIDIIEAHHRHKTDAPSGTALMLGEAAATGRNASLGDLRTAPYDGPSSRRAEGAIGFASSRTGGVIGEHEVRFGSETELIRLCHTALDRRVFAEGAIRAAEWASGRKPGLYSLDDVLGL